MWHELYYPCHLYQVVPHIVPLVKSLKSDGLPNSKTFLLQFAELVHCMMYQYSGFPDLYDSILESIKVRYRWGIFGLISYELTYLCKTKDMFYVLLLII